MLLVLTRSEPRNGNLQMDIIPDILMAYLASNFSEFHVKFLGDESTARMHWVIQPFKLRFSRWPRRNFQRCHGKFNILEGFKMLQDLLGIERRLELVCSWFFLGFGDTPMKLHGGFVWICHILPLWMGKPTRFLHEPTRMSRNSKRAELPLLHWVNDVHPS